MFIAMALQTESSWRFLWKSITLTKLMREDCLQELSYDDKRLGFLQLWLPLFAWRCLFLGADLLQVEWSNGKKRPNSQYFLKRTRGSEQQGNMHSLSSFSWLPTLFFLLEIYQILACPSIQLKLRKTAPSRQVSVQPKGVFCQLSLCCRPPARKLIMMAYVLKFQMWLFLWQLYGNHSLFMMFNQHRRDPTLFLSNKLVRGAPNLATVATLWTVHS